MTKLVQLVAAAKEPVTIERKAAPIVMVGVNIYIAWTTNIIGNHEVMFRASYDDGSTFADKINLSNTTSTDSQDVEISADGDTVIVTWWERYATNEDRVTRVSSDTGQTFGPPLKLATKGTVGETAGAE
jgi:hypothetical protein